MYCVYKIEYHEINKLWSAPHSHTILTNVHNINFKTGRCKPRVWLSLLPLSVFTLRVSLLLLMMMMHRIWPNLLTHAKPTEASNMHIYVQQFNSHRDEDDRGRQAMHGKTPSASCADAAKTFTPRRAARLFNSHSSVLGKLARHSAVVRGLNASFGLLTTKQETKHIHTHTFW